MEYEFQGNIQFYFMVRVNSSLGKHVDRDLDMCHVEGYAYRAGLVCSRISTEGFEDAEEVLQITVPSCEINEFQGLMSRWGIDPDLIECGSPEDACFAANHWGCQANYK